MVAPQFENDGDCYNDECEREEEGSKAMTARLRLGALLQHTIDHTKCTNSSPPLLCIAYRQQPDIHQNYLVN